jgi:outer membrane protein insertion porin family
VPFERFIYGGDGLSNQNSGITGATIIAARGYETNDFIEGNGTSVSNNNFSLGGGSIFNKFTVEIRYPLSLNPSSTIYVLGFLQGGNVWNDFKKYNPFDLQRSVGGGVRVFLPMFGLLGFDYGFGLDKDPNAGNFGGFGKFSIVLGFEPD